MYFYGSIINMCILDKSHSTPETQITIKQLFNYQLAKNYEATESVGDHSKRYMLEFIKKVTIIVLTTNYFDK